MKHPQQICRGCFIFCICMIGKMLDFLDGEEAGLKSAIENAMAAIPVILNDGTDAAMNRFNRKVV